MNRGFWSVRHWLKKVPVLLVSLVLGVVGIQAVLIAHMHKMITGQPLLLGQDHHGLSHLPPLFLSKFNSASKSISRFSTAHRPFSFFDSPDTRLARNEWDQMVVTPFIRLFEEGGNYVVLMESPDLHPGNLEITLSGRELIISSRSFTSRKTENDFVVETHFSEHRVRLPGAIVGTGPPKPEFQPGGRVKLCLKKADSVPVEKSSISVL
ncbi:MAG: Hsp20/alpha crystallin family protein [Kiritimatiellia bacterium]